MSVAYHYPLEIVQARASLPETTAGDTKHETTGNTRFKLAKVSSLCEKCQMSRHDRVELEMSGEEGNA
jgi:hypothetical protein